MITTTLQTKFAIQRILMIVICLVMGLWGVYDYMVKIPARARAYERGQVCVQVVQALDPASTPEDRTRAAETLGSELQKLLALGLDDNAAAPPRPDEVIESIKAKNEQVWLTRLVVFQSGLKEAERIALGATPTPQFSTIVDLARAGVNETAEITPPSKFDRMTQWAFILCLPFVPVFTWTYLKARSRVYRLDEDGSLHSPESTWTKGEIADIDMSRWMSKSVCEVVNNQGERVKLDDYVYKNTDLIAGALASERYPDEWDEKARQKKADTEGDTQGDVSGDGPGDEPGAASDEETIEKERAEV